jgi:hypothetical protein
MTIEVGSGRDARKEPGAVIPARAGGPAWQSRTVSRQHGAIWLGIGLATLARCVRSRRFHGQVITGIIGLAALAGIARETQASALTRLAAWDKARRLS